MKWYFSKYAEYTLRTSLSEKELRDALKRKCSPFSFASIKEDWSNKIKGPQGEILFRLPEFFTSKNPAEIILCPDGPGLRHCMCGWLQITIMQAPDSADTILHITIRPPEDIILFLFVWLAGCGAMIYHAIRWHDMPMLFGGCGCLLAMFALLHGCHALGKRKIPQIQKAFSALIDEFECERQLLADLTQETRE